MLLAKELTSARRFYPVLFTMVIVNLGIAVAAPIAGKALAATIDVLGFMILMTSYTMMGFSVSSFAEDRQDGTMELLLTCPVSKGVVLLAKLTLGLLLAVPLALLPYALSAALLLRVSPSTVAGLAVGSIFASVTASSVALLLVVLVKRTEVGVYLGFVITWIICYTPDYVLRIPVLKFLLPAFYIRNLFVSMASPTAIPIATNLLVLAVVSCLYLALAARIMEKEDAILTAV